MSRTSTKPTTPYLFPEMAADRTPPKKQLTQQDLINQKLAEAAFESRNPSPLKETTFTPRHPTTTPAKSYPTSREEVFFLTVQALERAYGDDQRVDRAPTLKSINEEINKQREEKRAQSFVEAFATDLADDPFATLVRLAQKPLFLGVAMSIAPKIYYLARNDSACTNSFSEIRAATQKFAEDFSTNKKAFVAEHSLNWNSAEQLTEFFLEHPL